MWKKEELPEALRGLILDPAEKKPVSPEDFALPCGTFSDGTAAALNLDLYHQLPLVGWACSGKSNLLHTLLLSARLNYAPDDLQLWVADGWSREFAVYEEEKVPGVRVLTQEDDLPALLCGELDSRIDLLVQSGAQSFAACRARCGRPGLPPLPRLLVLADDASKPPTDTPV